MESPTAAIAPIAARGMTVRATLRATGAALSAMTSTKLSVRATDLGVAQAIEAALAAAEPALDAVTLFEDGAGRLARRGLFAGPRRRRGRRAEVAAALGEPIRRCSWQPSPTSTGWRSRRRRCRRCSAGRFIVHGSHDRGRVPHGPQRDPDRCGRSVRHRAPCHDLGCLLAIEQLARASAHSAACSISAADRACWPSPRRGPCRGPQSWPPTSIRCGRRGRAPTPTPTASRRDRHRLRRGPRASVAASRAPFDLIIANILAGPAAHACAGDIAAACARAARGAVGHPRPEAPAVIAAYVAHGFQSEAPAASAAGRR